jgi:hypothetical protein
MRIVIRVPKVAIERLGKANPLVTVNSQISNILEKFRWDSLPFNCGFEVRGVQCEKLTIQLSFFAIDSMRNHCQRNRKSHTMVVAQALAQAGIYKIEELG